MLSGIPDSGNPEGGHKEGRATMARQDGEPYWLIHEPGKKSGFGTQDFDGDLDPGRAATRYRAEMEPGIREAFDAYGTQIEAVLVTLCYVNGQPVVSPVKHAA